MTETTPLVTIVIPTRDRVDLLSTYALPSALSQEGVTFEVVVVDDGSSDDTADRIASIADSRIRLLRHETPRGVSAARNTGIAAARGRWIAFLDDDDLWSPEKLALQLAAADRDGAEWAYAASIVVDASTTPLYAHPVPSGAAMARALQGGNVMPAGTSNVVVLAELMRAVGGFDETLSQGEDWDVWLRLADRAVPAVCNDVLVATLMHDQRSVFRSSTNVLAELSHMLAKHRPVTRQDKLSATEWLAEQHRQAGDRMRASSTHLRAALRYRSLGNLAAAAGSLAGAPGIRLVSKVLVRVRGATHLEPDEAGPVVEPEWLARYRTA